MAKSKRPHAANGKTKSKGKGLTAALSRHNEVEKFKQKIKSKNEHLEKKGKKTGPLKKPETVSEEHPTDKKDQVPDLPLELLRTRGYIPFEETDKILLIGEGDFSFAKSIHEQNLILNITATAYDTEKVILEKYPETGKNCLEYLRDAGIPVHFEVDATSLDKNKNFRKVIDRKIETRNAGIIRRRSIEWEKFDIIMFNFPHTGRGMKDQDRNIADHQTLLKKFFESTYNMTCKDNPGTKIAVTLFEGLPYSEWGIKKLARASGYSCIRSAKFYWSLFPGYHHRKTSGMQDTTKEAGTRGATIFIFQLSDFLEKQSSETKGKNNQQVSKKSFKKSKHPQSTKNNESDEESDD